MLPLSPPAIKWKISALSHLLTFCCLDVSIQGQTHKKKPNQPTNPPPTNQKPFKSCCKIHLPEAAPLSPDWKSAQTQHIEPQNGSSCPSTSVSTGIPIHTSSFPAVFVCLFSSSSSLTLNDLSSFLMAILSPFPSFISCLTSPTKERMAITPKPYFHIQQDKPTALTQWKDITFAMSFPLFIHLSCTALQNNTLKSILFNQGMNRSQARIGTSL